MKPCVPKAGHREDATRDAKKRTRRVIKHEAEEAT